MAYRLVVGAVATCAIMSVVAGCGSDMASGGPLPSASSSASSGLPQDGAPNVTDPLNLAPLIQNHCAAPSSEQIQTLGGPLRLTDPDSGFISAGGPNTGCGWVFTDGLGQIVGGPVTSVQNGLSEFYGANADAAASGGLPTLRELAPIEGYPAIQSTEGYEGDQSCVLLVGVSNTQVYGVKIFVSERHPDYKDPCGLASKVAAFAIQYLKTR